MSINEFNKNISATLARVERGEEVILTRHGKEIAVISARDLEQKIAKRKAAVEKLAALMREGLNLGGPATYEERTERGNLR